MKLRNKAEPERKREGEGVGGNKRRLEETAY